MIDLKDKIEWIWREMKIKVKLFR